MIKTNLIATAPARWIGTAGNALSLFVGGAASIKAYAIAAAIAVALGAALVAGAGIWHAYKVAGVRDAAFKAGLKEAEYEHQTALLEGLREGTRQANHLQGVKDAAIAEAKKRAQINASAAAGARSELDRLRKQADAGARDAGTSHSACTQYAAAANTVLNECASALVSLAETADGHVNDIRTLTRAWPNWQQSAALTRIEMPRSPFTPTPENSP